MKAFTFLKVFDLGEQRRKARDAYLSEATSLADLERRERDLMKSNSF